MQTEDDEIIWVLMMDKNTGYIARVFPSGRIGACHGVFSNKPSDAFRSMMTAHPDYYWVRMRRSIAYTFPYHEE